MAVTMATAEQALKIVYLNIIAQQLNTKPDALYDMIVQTSKDVVGKEVRKMTSFGVNGGVGAGTESGSLPKAGGNFYQQFACDTKNMFATIEISDKSIKASQSNVGAFTSLLEAELKGATEASKFNLARMLHGDGTGILATTSVASGVTSFTVDSTINLKEGQIIDLLDSGVAITNGTARRIIDIDRANKTVSIDPTSGTVSPTATTKLVVQGSYNLEIGGLKKIFTPGGTLYGVDRSANHWMNPYVEATVGTISDTKIQKVIDYLSEYMGGEVDYLLCSSGVKRAYIDYMESTKRTVNSMELKGGFSAISYNGIPFNSSPFADAGTLKVLSSKDYSLNQMGDWSWLDEDGHILKQIAGTPNWTATLVKYAELMCEKPGSQGNMTGISES